MQEFRQQSETPRLECATILDPEINKIATQIKELKNKLSFLESNLIDMEIKKNFDIHQKSLLEDKEVIMKFTSSEICNNVYKLMIYFHDTYKKYVIILHNDDHCLRIRHKTIRELQEDEENEKNYSPF